MVPLLKNPLIPIGLTTGKQLIPQENLMLATGLLLGGYWVATGTTGDYGLLMVTLKIFW